MAASLRYSQIFRAIGQSLEVLHINAFRLEQQGDNYILRPGIRESRPEVTPYRSFLDWVADVVWGHSESDKNPPDPKRFSEPFFYAPSEISWLENQGQSMRGKADAMPDPRKLSQVMRVLGDHLERKRAGACNVIMLSRSVSISYETSGGDRKHEHLTLPNLYALAVDMYLRRSLRRN